MGTCRVDNYGWTGGPSKFSTVLHVCVLCIHIFIGAVLLTFRPFLVNCSKRLNPMVRIFCIKFFHLLIVFILFDGLFSSLDTCMPNALAAEVMHNASSQGNYFCLFSPLFCHRYGLISTICGLKYCAYGILCVNET